MKKFNLIWILSLFLLVGSVSALDIISQENTRNDQFDTGAFRSAGFMFLNATYNNSVSFNISTFSLALNGVVTLNATIFGGGSNSSVGTIPISTWSVVSVGGYNWANATCVSGCSATYFYNTSYWIAFSPNSATANYGLAIPNDMTPYHYAIFYDTTYYVYGMTHRVYSNIVTASSSMITFVSPSDGNDTTKFLPQSNLVANVSVLSNFTNLISQNLSVYLSNGSLFTSFNSSSYVQFVNFSLPFTNQTYRYNVTIFNGSYMYSSTRNLNISYSVLNITLVSFNGSVINNFNISFFNSQYGTSSTIYNSTLFDDLIQGTSYNILVSPFYSNLFASSNVTFVSNYSPFQSLNISINPIDYVNFVLFNGSSGSRVVGASSVTLQSSNGSYSGSGVDTINFTNINAGSYSALVSSASFSLAQYSFGVNNNLQNISVYLFSNTSAVLFNFKTDSGATLPGVLLNVFSYVNGSLVLVDSVTSDISGKSQIYLAPNVAYYFNASLYSYRNNIFSLNPVIFSSYDVVMSALTSGSVIPTAVVSYSPNVFFRGSTSLNISVASSYCSLSNFSFNVSWDSGSNSNFTSSACGYNFFVPLSLSSASFVNVFYQYYLSNGVYQNWSFTYNIFVPQSNHTISTIGNNSFGMLIGDKVWLATLIVLIVMGVAFVALGVGGSLVFGSIYWLIFGQSNFVPWYLLYPSLVIGVLIIIGRGNNG